jgi:hypothetical protein
MLQNLEFVSAEYMALLTRNQYEVQWNMAHVLARGVPNFPPTPKENKETADSMARDGTYYLQLNNLISRWVPS